MARDTEIFITLYHCRTPDIEKVYHPPKVRHCGCCINRQALSHEFSILMLFLAIGNCFRFCTAEHVSENNINFLGMD